MQPLGENSINVPAFLGKLWKMVNDPNTDELICWGEGGKSFVIQNQAQFWYELLPLYYKHNNMSSFVRQLNMYGFHKISSVENGTMDTDKDEIIFFHPYFRKEEPELLKNIKRKVTVSKHENASQGYRPDDLTKVLTDVKHIRGRQASIDSELTAMKQENTVLWRELAILRQKHLKQQQIVNKLIQFLVTLVQPPRMGVGVKRRFPMLRESPAKRTKSKPSSNNNNNNNNTPHSSEGPTIHELDSELDMNSDQLYEEDMEENTPMINSPQTPTTSTSSVREAVNSPSSSTMLDEAAAESIIPESLGWVKPEMVDVNDIENFILSNDADENLNENIIDTLNDVKPNIAQCSRQKVFLNPNTQDTLLSNLINGSYNVSSVNSVDNSSDKNENAKKNSNKQNVANQIQDDNPMAVATREPLKRLKSNLRSAIGCYSNDLDLHVESTQSELNQLKDLLNGYNSFDANALLGELHKLPLNLNDLNLFSHESPELELTFSEEGNDTDSDPLMLGSEEPTGSELTTYGNNLIDFNELLDESLDNTDIAIAPNEINPQLDSINTPLIGKEIEPTFPHREMPKS